MGSRVSRRGRHTERHRARDSLKSSRKKSTGVLGKATSEASPHNTRAKMKPQVCMVSLEREFSLNLNAVHTWRERVLAPSVSSEERRLRGSYLGCMSE